jgi:hypothetical protein
MEYLKGNENIVNSGDQAELLQPQVVDERKVDEKSKGNKTGNSKEKIPKEEDQHKKQSVKSTAQPEDKKGIYVDYTVIQIWIHLYTECIFQI